MDNCFLHVGQRVFTQCPFTTEHTDDRKYWEKLISRALSQDFVFCFFMAVTFISQTLSVHDKIIRFLSNQKPAFYKYF